MKLAVLADTHIPKRAKALPQAALEIISGADAILHAGDILTMDFLQALRAMAPVYAVLGNNDIGLDLPKTLDLLFEGVRLSLVHDSGAKQGRANRMRKRFPQADIVVFGHSHMAVNETVNDLILFNPGSATDKRKQAKHTLGWLECTNGRVSARIVELD